MNKRILIITYTFPPLNNIMSHIADGIIRHMPLYGFEPFIVTTKSFGDIINHIPEDHVMRIGTHYDTASNLVSHNLSYHDIPSLIKPLYFIYRHIGAHLNSIDRFTISWKKEILKQLSTIRAINPDIIMATCYPAGAIWIGRTLARIFNKPWIADLRDPLSLWNESSIGLIHQLDMYIDRFAIQNASAIITVGPYLARVMEEQLYRRPVKIVYNGFDEPTTIPIAHQITDTKHVLYYAGRFHKHRIPAVKLLIDCLAQNPSFNTKLVIRSIGPREANQEIITYANHKKVDQFLEVRPPVHPSIICNEMTQAHALLIFEDITKTRAHTSGTVTGKLFEYLPYQAPIIAIAPSNSDIEIILKDTNRGWVTPSTEILTHALDAVNHNKIPHAIWDRVAIYSRKNQCKILCSILDNVLAN